MKKTIPSFKTDDEAEAFVETADLSQYDLRGEVVRFEMKKKDASLHLRLPETLLAELRRHAKEADMPMQRVIRLAIERTIRQSKPQ